MRLRRARIIATFVFLAAAGLGRAAASPPPATTKPFDGNWWLSASQRERLGYMEGDNDCSVFEFQGPEVGWDDFTTYQAFVTSYYAEDASHRGKSAFDVLRLADKQIGATTNRADLPTEPHGDYDGLFWRESFDRERLGFIEGYLQCYAHKPAPRRSTFSRSYQAYVTMLNAWYRLNDVERDVDLKIENAKIADVLFRKFRDRRGFMKR
ncbi:MAG: hypothetical protein ACRD4S_02410 [Candidatus Acidiferrales bacterium]